MAGKKPTIRYSEKALALAEHLVGYDDAERCMEYLLLAQDTAHYSQGEIAERFEVDADTLLAWRRKWLRSGLLKAARTYLLADVAERIRSKTDQVLENWDAIVQKQIDTAKTGSPRTALMAAAWLKQEFVDPALAQSRGGSEEETFLAENAERDYRPPMIIEAPSAKKLSSG